MLEHCGITFSWGTKFGKGRPILAAKIGPGDRFWRRTDFFVTGQGYLPEGFQIEQAIDGSICCLL